MTNISILIVYLPIAIMTVLVLFFALHSDIKRKAMGAFVFLAGTILLWQICCICFVLAPSPWSARLFLDLQLPCSAFAAMAFFLFSMRFYQLDKYVSLGTVTILSIVPVISLFLALTSPYHTYIHQEIFVLAFSPLKMITDVAGIWSTFHMVYVYVILLISLGIVLYQHKKLPKSYRLASTFLITGILATLASNFVKMTNLFSAFDSSLIGISLSSIFCYFAIAGSEPIDFLIMARNEIYNYLEEYIFILDTDRKIMDINRSATQWAQSLGIEDIHIPFDQLIKVLESIGADIKKSVEDTGMDIYLSNPSQRTIYNMKETPILGEDGSLKGVFAVCMDVTKNREVIQRLEHTAGIDALTGLLNRYGYELAKAEMDCPENLPLTVVIGDANRLKYVNDTYGHLQGDALLQAIAQTLRTACPPGGQVCRMGGDEFVMLFPKCAYGETEEIIQTVHDKLNALRGYPVQPSISLGYAVKEEESQDIGQMLAFADANMYLKKTGRSVSKSG